MLTFMSLWIGQQLRCFCMRTLVDDRTRLYMVIIKCEQYLKDTLHG